VPDVHPDFRRRRPQRESDAGVEGDQVKLYVWYLRQKIENDPKNPKMIVIKRGLGYTFVG
jgi:DNA-binding response OmpR family regulator